MANMRTAVIDDSSQVGQKSGIVERRRSPHYLFTAAIQSLDSASGARIDAHTTGLSSHGCYVDVMNPFPAGTNVRVRLTKDGKTFDANATVAYCKPNVGMRLRFASENASTFDGWLSELRGESPPELPALNEHPAYRNSDSRLHDAVEQLLFLLMRNGTLTEEEVAALLRMYLF